MGVNVDEIFSYMIRNVPGVGRIDLAQGINHLGDRYYLKLDHEVRSDTLREFQRVMLETELPPGEPIEFQAIWAMAEGREAARKIFEKAYGR